VSQSESLEADIGVGKQYIPGQDGLVTWKYFDAGSDPPAVALNEIVLASIWRSLPQTPW